MDGLGGAEIWSPPRGASDENRPPDDAASPMRWLCRSSVGEGLVEARTAVDRFERLCGESFFFPPLRQLSDVVAEPRWLPRHQVPDELLGCFHSQTLLCPVFLVSFSFNWSRFESLVAGEKVAKAAFLTRPYVYF